MHFQLHSMEKQYLCDICGEIFSDCYFFKIHVHKHTKEKLGIGECKIFKLQLDFSIDEENNEYSEDEQSHNPNTDDHKKFSCKLCKKTFFLQNYLIFHLRSHTKEKCLLCHLCGRRYSNHHYFKMHLRAHRKVKRMISSLSQTTLPVEEEVAQTPLEELLASELLTTIIVEQEVSHLQLKELLTSQSLSSPPVKQEISQSQLKELFGSKHFPQPFDHMQSRNPVEPCQRATIVSDCNRTEIRKVNPLDSAKMASYLPNSEFSYIPEQGLSVSNIFDQALSHNSVSVISSDFSAQASSHSSDSNQLAVNCFPEISGQTYSEESVLGLDPPNFGQISYSHAHSSVVKDAKGRKVYCCVVCNRRFTFVCHLNEHLRNHWHKKLATCKVCQTEFFERKQLNQHFCDRTNIKKLTCDKCHKVFIREKALRLHVLTHTTTYTPYVCNVCEKLFQLKRHLYAHITRVHKRKEYFYCNLCEKQYPFADALQIHDCEEIDRNPYVCEKNPYVCDVCDANFQDKATLLQHDCPYAVKDACLCDICQRNTLKSSPNQDMYVCNLCDETFSQKSDLRDHLRNGARSQVLSCGICKKKFTHKCSFDSHVCNDQRSKLLSCILCEKKFSNDATFQKHLNSHLDKEPFECHFCDKIFIRKHHLMRHVRTHNE